MSMHNAIFYFFSALSILCATMVIVSKNPVRAVLNLIVTFVSMAALWLLLEAEFLAIALVLVYVGAVMVLFLFVIMMLNIDLASLKDGFAKFLPLGICISVLVVLGLITAVGPEDFGLQKYPEPMPHGADFSNIKDLGELLYVRYLFPFEIAGILLLVAIIASISLSFRGGKREGIAHKIALNPSLQNRAMKKDRLQIISMNAEKNQDDLC